jgi:ABC-type multidrug transport system ATPase subunit
MPGRFSLYPDLSVLENLTFFAALFDTTVAEARATIAPIWVQLEQFSSRRAGALSGGMKQKLALCCALVHRPEILFLDEPTTGVDAVSRKEFWDLLARLRADGLPIVVSTPYMDEAVRCDRVSLMQGGRLLATDRPQDIERRYPRPLFAVRGPDVLGLLDALRRFPHAAAVWPFGESLHYTDARADVPAERIARELQAYLDSAGLTGVSLAPMAASIEDAFMWHMGQARAA